MKRYLILLLIFVSYPAMAQEYILDSLPDKLKSLINFEANHFKGAENSTRFDYFFKQLDSVYEGHNNKLHIFHIGGSHIQADIYSNKIRTYLHNMSPNSQSQRGFVFPFELAHTNNPSNYKISANKSKWTGYRSSVRKDSVAWGLSGVSAAFRAVSDTIKVQSNFRNETKTPYTFSSLRVFYNSWKSDYDLTVVNSDLLVSEEINLDKMYKQFNFNKELQEVELCLTLKDSAIANPEFLMMGMEFMNKNSGIEYTSIGVNGGSFVFYDRTTYFETQLELYKPDLFIIAIGTNDAYMPIADFDAEKFRYYYDAFIAMIRRVNPNCAILLTVPNDDYYKRKVPNPNTVTQQKIITELSEKYQMAVWDFFEVMGGLGSSNKWYRNNLMPKDRIHFTRLGYSIKGDLFISALIQSWAESTGRNEKQLRDHFSHLNE